MSEDSNNIKSLSDFKTKKKSESLQEQNDKLLATCSSLRSELHKFKRLVDEKEKKIKHLEEMLTQTIPMIGEEEEGKNAVELISDEEMTVLTQLKRLNELSQQRPLTIDETRTLDVLIKNKRLLQGKSTTISSKSDDNKLKDQPRERLLQVASNKNIPQRQE